MDLEDRKRVIEGIFFPLALILSVYLIAYSYVSGVYSFFKVPAEVIQPGIGILIVSLAVLALAVFVFSPLVTELLMIISKNEIVRVTFWFAFWWGAYTFFAGFNLYATIIILVVCAYVFVMPFIRYSKIKGKSF